MIMVPADEKPEKNPIVPDVKAFIHDEDGKQTFKRDLNKNTFELRSTYINYKPSEDAREMRMEQKWEYNRN